MEEQKDSTEKPRSPLGRRLLRVALRVILGVVVVIAVVVGYLHTPWGEERLRARIEGRLAERVSTTARVGALSFSIFRGVRLGRIAITGNDGKDAITIASIDITPRWAAIVGGTPTLAKVEIGEVRAAVRGKDDGTTNLTAVFVERKSIDHIVVEKLVAADIGFTLDKPDGTHVVVEGAALDATADAQPVLKTFALGANLAIAKLKVDKPGLSVEGQKLGTRVRVDLARGEGPVKLGPTRADFVLRRDGKVDYPFTLDAPSVEAKLGVADLEVVANALRVAALSVVSLRVATPRDAVTTGEPKLFAERLVIDAAALNAIAGKRVLSGDIGIDVDVKGPANALGVGIGITTPGGALAIAGRADLPGKSFDLTLTSKALDVSSIVALETVPPARIGSLSLAVRASPAVPTAHAVLEVEGVTVRKVAIERALVDARYDGTTVTIDKLEVFGLGQTVRASGTYVPNDKALNLSLKTEGSIGKALASLKEAGIDVPSSPVLASLGLARPLDVKVSGKLDRSLAVAVNDVELAILGGRVQVHGDVELLAGDPEKGQKRFRANDIDLSLDLRGVSIAAIGALRGRNLPVRGTIDGKVRLTGVAARPDGDIDLVARVGDARGGPERRGKLELEAKLVQGHLAGRARLHRDDGAELLQARLDAVIDGSGISQTAPFTLALNVDRRPLVDIGALLEPTVAAKLPKGDVEVHADLRGSFMHPTGQVHAVVDGELAPGRLAGSQHAELDLEFLPSPKGMRSRVAGQIRAGEVNVSAAGTVDVAGSLATIRTAPLAYDLEIGIPELSIDSLPLVPERMAALQATHGRVKAAIHARGTRDDLTADATLSVRELERGAIKRVDADVAVHLTPERTSLSVDGRVDGAPLLEGRASVGLAGKTFFARVRRASETGWDLPLEAALVVPRTSLSKIAPIPTSGVLAGQIDVVGTTTNPRVSGGITLDDVAALDGGKTRATLAVHGGLDALVTELAIADALSVTVETSPKALVAARGEGVDVPVSAKVRAAHVPIARLLPDLASLSNLDLAGSIDGDIGATLALRVDTEGRSLKGIDVRGSLAIGEGRVRVPASSRVIKDIGLVLEGDGDGVRMATLEAHESDLDKPDRRLRANGRFAIPTRRAALHVALADVLVFGGVFGKADAPRGALTGEVDVDAELAGPTRKVDVVVRALDLRNPDRFLRSHHQEVLGLGDVIELGGGGAPIGKLVRTSEAKPAKGPTVVDRPRGEKTLEVRVHVPVLAHIKQRPLDLYARGDVMIDGYGDARELSGKLVCEKGDLLVGGLEHRLDRGEVRFGSEGAFLDLHFHRDPSPAALRDFAGAERATLYAHMVGPFGKQKLSFSGVADGLLEGLAMNAGRARVLSSPDAPASQTAQLPQSREIRQTAFMSANLPHLAFLTRMNTLADPNDGRTYGRFQLLEGERYDGARRLRVTRRAPVIGQSEGEVEYDLLFQNTPRVVSGVGLLGGTRVGGGPAVFWEWSSAD